MRYRHSLAVVSLLSGALLFSGTAQAGNASSDLNRAVADIRYQVTAIEHDFDTKDVKGKVQAFDDVIDQAAGLIDQFPDRAEPYVWKGIALSAQAKHKGISALSSVRQARRDLERAIAIDPAAADGAAYNALAMLYAKVPSWPIAFGNDKKAEEYFHKALAVSSNLDTNYRFGEFLAEHGRTEEGLRYLQKALAFSDRPGRKEESLKKQEIAALIQHYQENSHGQ